MEKERYVPLLHVRVREPLERE
jgi:hypothetical protein